MQRFLYGLRDEEMRFTVKYHKEPVSLDEAIYYAVEYAELRRRVFEGHCIDKEISKQRKEECYQYNKTHNKTADCCYPEGSHTAIKAVVQRPTYQTSKAVDSLEHQSHDEVLEVLLQIKDSLQTYANHKCLDNSGDSHWKSHQADTHVCYDCISRDPILGNCPDRNSDNLCTAEESHTDTKLLPQGVCNSDTVRNANCLTSLSEEGARSENRTCRLHTNQEQRWSSDMFRVSRIEVENDGKDSDYKKRVADQQTKLSLQENYLDPSETIQFVAPRVSVVSAGNSRPKEQGPSCTIWTSQCASATNLDERGSSFNYRESWSGDTLAADTKGVNSNHAMANFGSSQANKGLTLQNGTQTQTSGGEQSKENDVSKQITYQVLIPRNKLLPCKGEKPPKMLA